jgi:hypothetical protein
MTAVSLVAQAGTTRSVGQALQYLPPAVPSYKHCCNTHLLRGADPGMLLLVHLAVPACASLCAMLLDRLAGFTLGFTGMISSMQHGVITGIGMSASETVMLTVTAALLLAALLRTAKITLRPPCCGLTPAGICNTIKTAQEMHRDRIITYNIRG